MLWLFLQFAYQEPGVAWEAHVGGFIAGVLITLPLRTVLLGRIRRLHEPVPQYRMLR
jgi:membrane associated rhomboid family serine protease